MTVTALVAFAVPQAQAHCGACGAHAQAEEKQDIFAPDEGRPFTPSHS